MTKRRTKGEGTIYQRKDGRYCAQYRVETLDGTKKRTIYGKSKHDVRTELTEAIANRDKGLVFDAQNLSLSDYLDRWLEGIEGTIGKRTFDRHESIVRLHLKPAIGSTKLAVLNPLQIQSFYRAKSRTHLAPGSVKRIHTTLHKALRSAVRWRMIPRNPTDDIDRPRGYRGEIRPLTKEQVHTLLSKARETQPRLYALYVLGITAGLRQSEIVGLQWPDLKLEESKLTVKRGVFKGTTLPPKTARGSRTVRLTRMAVAALRDHEQQHKASDLWVFATRTGNTLDASNLHRDHWKKLLRDAGIEHTSFHAGTRHTCATLLLGKSVHPKLVAELLGHASIKTTINLYSHALPEMQDGVADMMDNALG